MTSRRRAEASSEPESASAYWRAALLQGLAVLLGILAAFALDAAWDARNQRLAADAYLESLSTELGENRSEFERSLQALGESIARNQGSLVDLVYDGGDDVTSDSIRSMMTSLAPISVVPPRRAAFDDLASGGLQTIEQAELRRLVLRYGQELDAVQSVEEATAAWHLAQFVPYEVSFGDVVGVLSSMGGGWAGRTDLRFDLDPAAFVGNRRFANILANYILREGMIHRARQQLLDTLIELDEALSRR